MLVGFVTFSILNDKLVIRIFTLVLIMSKKVIKQILWLIRFRNIVAPKFAAC